MSSLAQEEARSISENCTWGQRKRVAEGNASVALDQNEYQKRYDTLVAQYNMANDRLEAVTA